MNYTFRLVVQSDTDFEQLSQLFYEEFDGLLAETQGRLLVQINASTALGAHEALRRTIEDVERVLPVRVQEVDGDLVDIPEIADRIGRSRQNVQQLVTGQRGHGAFPPPVATPGGIRIWDWESVAQWLIEAGVSDVHDVGASRTDVARANAWLATRQEAAADRIDRALAGVAAVVQQVPELAQIDIDRTIGGLGALWRALLTQPLQTSEGRTVVRHGERLTAVELQGTAVVVARAGSAVRPENATPRVRRRVQVAPQLDDSTLARLVGAA